MKKVLLVMVLFIGLSNLKAQVVINELMYNGGDMVELKNLGSSPVDVSSWWLCTFPLYNQISSLTIVSGSTTIPPNGLLVISGHTMGADEELGLYTTNSFSSSSAIVDYVEWESTPHQRSSVAVTAGVWLSGQFLPATPSGSSIEFDGSGDNSTDYQIQSTPTFGSENGIVLSVEDNFIVDNSIKIYPNPVLDKLTIEQETTLGVLSIEIIDVQGRVLMSKALSTKTSTIDVSSFAKGAYYIRYLDEAKAIIGTQRFIKN